MGFSLVKAIQNKLATINIFANIRYLLHMRVHVTQNKK